MGDYEADEIRNIMSSALGGDVEALDALCRRIRPRLLKNVDTFMTGRARRVTDPEDVTQQVLADLVARPGDFIDLETPEKTVHLLTRRAKWRTMDIIRAEEASRGESEIGKTDGAVAPMSSTGPVTSNDDKSWLRDLIEYLQGRPRDVVLLCGLEGKSYAEAAEILDISADSVRKAYARANDALKAAAAERGSPNSRRQGGANE